MVMNTQYFLNLCLPSCHFWHKESLTTL